MIRTLMTTRMITAKEWNYVTTESIEGENNAVVAEVPFFLSSDRLRLWRPILNPIFKPISVQCPLCIEPPHNLILRGW